MTHNPSNPLDNAIEPWQLTAYALNELDPVDANRIEQALESDSSLRVEFEQIQQTLTAVRSALAETPASVKLSETQTATVASQIEQVAAPIQVSSINKVQFADRPFYRRKRFAALLATAAAIPLAATWLPSLLEDGVPLADHKHGQTLPRSYYRNDDVEYLGETNGLEATRSKTIETTANVPDGRSILLGGINRNRKLLNQDGEKQASNGSARIAGSSVAAETNTLTLSVTPRIIIPEEQESILVRGQGAMAAGGSSDAKLAQLGRLPQLTESLAANDKRIRDLELNRAEQLPAELRQNAPHLFNTPAIDRTSTDRFEKIVETPFLETQKAPLSTFSIDVDTASYSKIRQTLMEGNRLPSPSMVRIEEMVNYFEYEYAGPQDDRPFSAHMIIDRCPWNAEHQLVRVGLQAKKLDKQNRVKANIVFLLDVSGSMNEPNKLPLVKKALSMLVNQLTENDRVAIVVYAGAAGCVLPSTCGIEKQKILSSLDHLNAGGSTNGGHGIQLAYSIAKEQFIPGGANRVVLCTDGDFNVGVTGDDALVAMMQENAKSNIFLTCLGFGAGNYNDTMMEKISNKGNGIYGMIDNELEARRMMVEQLGGTLVTVAKDVKIQVDFNPAKVAGYRLIGYEDRRLANKDFDNDQKDAGEIGAGHRVTALYEVIPAGKSLGINPPSDSESSKYFKKPKSESKFEAPVAGEYSSEVLTLKVRYKEPEGSVSNKQEFVLNETDGSEKPLIDRDMQWATSVAEFGLLLRRSQMAPQADWSDMLERAASSAGGDAYRLECLAMMRKARSIFP